MARAATRGEIPNLDDKTRDLLNALVDQVAEDRSWPPAKTRTAIRAALDAQWSLDDVVTGLADIADDPNTAGPGRLVAYLGVRRAKQATQQAAVVDDQTPLRVLGRDTPRCRVAGHEAELATNCVQCKTEKLGDDAGPVVAMDRQSAIAAAKAAAGAKRTADRRVATPDEARPSGLDRLNAVVQELGVAVPVFADAG